MTTYMQYSHTESLPLILFIACTILVATAAKVSSAPHTLDLGARFDSSFSLEYHVLFFSCASILSSWLPWYLEGAITT